MRQKINPCVKAASCRSLGKPNSYPEECVDYIRKNIVGTSYRELADDLNRIFGTNYNSSAIKAFCNRKLGLTNYVNRWTEEEKEYLRQNVQGKSFIELSEEISKIIGVKRTSRHCRDMAYRMGLHNGIDMKFKDGHEGYGKNPIGTEIRHGRKTYVKVSDTHRISKEKRHGNYRNFRLKHELLWEQEHGEIPKGCIVIFADGNRNNFNMDNLICVPNSIKTAMNAKGWQFLDNEMLRKCAIRSCILNYYLKKEKKICLKK